MKKRSLYGINEHFEDIFNVVRECKMTFAYSSSLLETWRSGPHPIDPESLSEHFR